MIHLWSLRASSYTRAMEEPGSMSWNWFSSSFFHAASMRSSGYSAPFSMARLPHISASRRASSDLRLPFLMAAWEVNTPRWAEKYSSPT